MTTGNTPLEVTNREAMKTTLKRNGQAIKAMAAIDPAILEDDDLVRQAMHGVSVSRGETKSRPGFNGTP